MTLHIVCTVQVTVCGPVRPPVRTCRIALCREIPLARALATPRRRRARPALHFLGRGTGGGMDSTSSAISEMSTMLRRPPALAEDGPPEGAAGTAGILGIGGIACGIPFGSGGGPAGGRLLPPVTRPAATSASSRSTRSSSAAICARIATASAMRRTSCALCSPVFRLRESAIRCDETGSGSGRQGRGPEVACGRRPRRGRGDRGHLGRIVHQRVAGRAGLALQAPD